MSFMFVRVCAKSKHTFKNSIWYNVSYEQAHI